MIRFFKAMTSKSIVCRQPVFLVLFILSVFSQISAAQYTFETEFLPIADQTSGCAHRVFGRGSNPDDSLSNGYGTVFESKQNGDFISYSVFVSQAGTYTLRIGIKKSPNRGITQVSVNGTKIGSPVDHYSNPETYNKITI